MNIERHTIKISGRFLNLTLHVVFIQLFEVQKKFCYSETLLKMGKRQLGRVIYNEIDNGRGEFFFPDEVNSETFYTLGKNRSSSNGVKLKVWIDTPVNVAGGNVYGRLELTVSKKNLKLGDIIIELAGYEGTFDSSLV
jgi:hypothetical protein